jgi:DNA-binding response OmpR family regulator
MNTILLVDDEHDITFTFRIGLEDNGFEVDMFNDPQEALSNFKAGLYDLLHIDVKMPKMNGFELYTTKCAPMIITAAFLIYGLVFPVDFVFVEKPDSGYIFLHFS